MSECIATITARGACEVSSVVILFLVLIVAAITDVRTGKIHNWTTYPAIAIGLIGHTLIGGLTGNDASMGLTGSLFGLAAGFLPMLAAWLAGGIGGGDAKLMGAVGALAGWRFVLHAMFMGFAVAVALAVIVMLKHRILRRTFARVFRFVYLLLTPTKPVDPATADSPKIPFGLALCIGGFLAMVQLLVQGSDAPKFLLGF